MHPTSLVWRRFEVLILRYRLEESYLEGALNGGKSPSVVHDLGERWIVNGQSGTATPPQRTLGTTSSELFPRVPNDCKYSKSTPHFFLASSTPSAAALRDRQSDLAYPEITTCNNADSKGFPGPRCVTGRGLHIDAGIPGNTTHMNAASTYPGTEGVP